LPTPKGGPSPVAPDRNKPDKTREVPGKPRETPGKPRETPGKPREIPGNVLHGESPSDSLEERLGPLGITFGAVAACALVWLIAVWLRLF